MSRRRKQTLRLLAGLCIVLLVCGACLKLSSARSFQLFGELLYRGQTNEKLVALTFDDGPVEAATSVLLDLLADRRVKASFFLIGRDMQAAPNEVRRIASAGHEIGNHSWSHLRMVFKSMGFLRDELARTDALIRASGYRGPIHFRPPYGKRLVLLPWLLRQQKRLTVMWDVEPESDPDIDGDTDAIVNRVLRQVQPGSIILLHPMYPGRAPTLAAVPLIIDALQRDGWRFVTVSEMHALRGD